MNTQLAPEEHLDELDEFEPETPRGGFNLRDGGTDLFRGVLVALIALAAGALVLSQGYGGDEEETSTDESATITGELTAADPDGTMTEEESDAAADDDPAAPATDGESDATMTDDAMADPTTTDGTGTETSTSDPTATTTATTAPTVTDTARPASEVQVVVLNATERKGIAGQGTELLEAANYDTVPAGNATSPIGSVIFYLEGYRADAIAISQVFTDGLEGLVQPYDPTAPPAAADDIADAKVIVVLGADDAIPIG